MGQMLSRFFCSGISHSKASLSLLLKGLVWGTYGWTLGPAKVQKNTFKIACHVWQAREAEIPWIHKKLTRELTLHGVNSRYRIFFPLLENEHWISISIMACNKGIINNFVYYIEYIFISFLSIKMNH